MIQSILIDQREPEHVQQMSFDGAPTVVTLLEHGDLHVLCDDALLVIERKTPDDLLNSLRDERLMSQLTGLLSMEAWPYLIIDGQFQRGTSGKVITDGRETGWSWASLQGALLTVQEIGINVIYSGGDFEKAVLWLARHSRSNSVRVHPRRCAIFATPAEQVLASLPGIGESKAEEILNHHSGSLAWAICSLLDPEWDRQPAVGPKTKDNLRQLFGLADGEILWPYYRDNPQPQPERTNTK